MKKYLLASFAVAIAVASVAFTTKPVKAVKSNNQFHFIGTTTSDYLSADKWEVLDSPSDCGEGTLACSVTSNNTYADNDVASFVADINAASGTAQQKLQAVSTIDTQKN